VAVYKFFLNGPLGSGKTEAIKAVSDLPLISALKKVALTQNEISLDYGRVHVDSDMCYLYAPAEGSLNGRDWLGLCQEMDGLIFIVDGSAESLAPAYDLFTELLKDWIGATVVGVNDIAGLDQADDAYAELAKSFGASFPVYPFNALVRPSVLALIRVMVAERRHRHRDS
jgi:uncharacterized protein